MSSDLRKEAVAAVAAKGSSRCACPPEFSIGDIYGCDVFNIKTMKEYLPKEVFKKLMATIEKGAPIDASIADVVANAMKRWAVAKGATHYTHWFQPLTGSTAEKHDSFVDASPSGEVSLKFSGKNLIQGEPDASSFPSGGLRATFEARGYTAWDPTSPAFIKRSEEGSTLCIPTAFCSYTGEALDKKTPLLRSMQVVSAQATRLLKCFGVEVDSKVHANLGAEQEYFLIDKSLYLARPDLIQTGRTLYGAEPSKHQQLDDHYFGSIKPRVLAFMAEVDKELWMLGIPAQTRHNEVAPAQFEIAPTFEELNLAVDHNMIVMETLRMVADRHGFVCLLHEKPYAGINGSGKHNNWSIGCKELNLLDPGDDPHQNAIFLTVLCAVIKAVDTHADLLRVSTATAGNDHRLGANEAPPAIISIFLGDQLNDVIEQIEKGSATGSRKGGVLQIGVDALPPLPRDATDRNRTSPFAFTGNKFEFRAPGSNMSCAGPNIVLNTIVAEALDEIASEIEKFDAATFNESLQALLQSIIQKHKRVIFNGDNYSADWAAEAESRGLPNMRTTPEALKPLLDDTNITLLGKYGVMTPTEVKSRYEVFTEEYATKIGIESSLALSMAKTMLLPVAVEFQKNLIESLLAMKDAGIEAGSCVIKAQAEKVGSLLTDGYKAAGKLEAAIAAEDSAASIAAMGELRTAIDALEVEVDDNLWPLPKYGEMLFVY